MGLHFGGHTPQVAASSPPIGGNDAIQGSVRPRRCRPRATNRGNCTTRGSDTPATRHRRASCSAKPPSQPARSAPHRLQDRCRAAWREKVRPTPPLRRLSREKTRPARAKTPNLGCCERAGRTFSRFHDLTVTQGELFRACRRRPSSARPISDQAPLGWRVPADPKSPAAVPMSSARALP